MTESKTDMDKEKETKRDSKFYEEEKMDKEYEHFVLEQVIRYADLVRASGKVYPILMIASIVMGVLGIILGKSVPKSLIMMLWSTGFYAAMKASQSAADEVLEGAEKIKKAMADPDFDIPDDYPDDILALRSMVCPTLKNVRSQIIAYGVLSVTLWAAALLFFFMMGSGGDEYHIMFLLLFFLMGSMALGITILAVRAIKDLPAARAYENYLNEKAARK